jgi:MFS family permease
VVVEVRSREPMVPFELFRSRDFAGANLFTLLFYFSLGGTLFFLPFDLIWVHGYSATAAGAAIVPAILLVSLLSRFAGDLADRYGARPLLVIGGVVAAVGFALFAVPGVEGGSYWTTFFPASVVLGVGMAAQASAVTTVALGSVDARRSGLASAINNAFSQTAALLAVAVLGVLMFWVFGGSLDARLEALELPPAARQQLEEQKTRLGAAEVPEGLQAAPAVERAIDEAFVAGYRAVMLVVAGTALASALGAGLLISGKKPEGRPAEHAPEHHHEDLREEVLFGLKSKRTPRRRTRETTVPTPDAPARPRSFTAGVQAQREDRRSRDARPGPPHRTRRQTEEAR